MLKLLAYTCTEFKFSLYVFHVFSFFLGTLFHFINVTPFDLHEFIAAYDVLKQLI